MLASPPTCWAAYGPPTASKSWSASLFRSGECVGEDPCHIARGYVAPSRKLLTCVGDMYFEHSRNLECDASYRDRTVKAGTVRAGGPFCHRRDVVRVLVNKVL
jgi:hypothetical protein